MAIAVSLNPAWVGPSTTVNLSSAAFSPVAGSLIIVDSHIDLATASPLGFTPSITDSVGLTWNAIGTPQRGTSGGWVMSWWAYTATARTNMTVSVDWNGSAANKAIKVRTFTGTATASAVISKTQGTSTTNNLSVSVTNTNNGCLIAGAALDWAARGLPTSTDSLLGYHLASAISGGSAHKAANTSGTGVSVSLNFDGGGTQATDWSYRIYEIVPASGGTDLVAAGATQAQTSDSPSLTQVHNLTVAAASEAQTSDNVALAQVHNLTASPAAQAFTSDSPTLTQVHNLAIQDSNQAQTSDAPALAQVHNLAAQNASQSQTSDSPTLSQSGSGSLVVDSASQAVTSDNVVLTQVHSLAVDSASQAMASDSPSLVLTINLVVNDAAQAMASGSPALTQIHNLFVADAVQLQDASNVALTQIHFLLASGALMTQTSDNVSVVPVTDVHLIARLPFDGPASGAIAGDGPVIAAMPRV